MFTIARLRHTAATVLTVVTMGTIPGFAMSGAKPTDPQIAHTAYTAGDIEIRNAELALSKSSNTEVRSFADDMVRDHTAVNDKALALVKKLNVTPQDNPTSQYLVQQQEAERSKLNALSGDAFDKAYVANEFAYHLTVQGALEATLIPSSQNPELKALLQSALKIFQEHEKHAEHLAMALK